MCGVGANWGSKVPHSAVTAEKGYVTDWGKFPHSVGVGGKVGPA